MPFGENPLQSLMHRERGVNRGTEAQSNEIHPLAVEHAKKLLTKNELPLSSFEDLYGVENIARDEKYVRGREEEFKQKLLQATPAERKREESITKAATVFEAMTFDGVKKYGWFGPDATPFKTSRYDDLANGVDMVAEIYRGDNSAQHLALAIDVTFGERAQEKKLEHIRRDIEKDKLAKIKYFQSERSGFRGELSMIPRAVIGIDPQNVARMTKLWASDPAKLRVLPAHMALLDEIQKQMEAFKMFAKKQNASTSVRAYERAGSIIDEILSKKKKEMPYQTLDNDRVYRAIIESAKRFAS